MTWRALAHTHSLTADAMTLIWPVEDLIWPNGAGCSITGAGVRRSGAKWHGPHPVLLLIDSVLVQGTFDCVATIAWLGGRARSNDIFEPKIIIID